MGKSFTYGRLPAFGERWENEVTDAELFLHELFDSPDTGLPSGGGANLEGIGHLGERWIEGSFAHASPFTAGRVSALETEEAEVFYEELTGRPSYRPPELAETPGGAGALSPNTQAARRRFPAMYQGFRARLTQAERQTMQAFTQGWTLPDPCPFANNNSLNRKEKALLAGAMLAAAGVKGTDCGDWVMRIYQYSQGDPYISRPAWTRMRIPGLRHPEYRWRSLAWSRTAVHPTRLRLIEPGCWVMYKTGSQGHSVLVARVIRRNIGRNTGTIRLEVLESGWFSRVNIPPRYRTLTLNCGAFRNGVRQRVFGSIFSIQTPQRSAAYQRWLRQRSRSGSSP